MTNDKQQAEAWQAEFDAWWNDTYLKTFGSMPNVVMLSYREVSFQAFMESKRSMQPIDLPEEFWKDCEAELAEEIIATITAAGYIYRVAK